jgi:hypothetical protein
MIGAIAVIFADANAASAQDILMSHALPVNFQ